MKVKIVKWAPGGTVKAVDALLQRQAFDEDAEEVARKVLAEIKAEGNRAVVRCALEFDGVSLRPPDLAVTAEEMKTARDRIDPSFRATAREVLGRITAFAKAGMKKDWSMSSAKGGTLGEQFCPLDRVGAYIPGGTAPLVSSALMTVALAKVAGVPEIVACTPCGKDKAVNPYLLNALEMAGATEIYRVGGIQAIGMMAYGTKTVNKVQKIVGPGGAYVTAAKRQVYGDVALDLVAGPSEIAVLADDTAVAAFIAADLLSQAEHGTGREKALLVTPSIKLAESVQQELDVQAETLSRREAVLKVMKDGMLIVVTNTLDEGMELCNRFAPEHLELMVREPRNWLKAVRSAGAVFVGTWSPESTGDFVAGPSHVLPTGGSAAMFSGLTADDFMRRTSFIAFTRADLMDTLPAIEMFARIEGLDGHGRSAGLRFEKKNESSDQKVY